MTDTIAPTTSYVDQMPLARIKPDPLNPRRTLGDLTDLTASIAEKGIYEPLIVAPDPDDLTLDDEPATFVLVAGHRRYAAAAAAGVDTVPAVVRADLTDPAARLEAALIENTQRNELGPLEEAAAFAKLVELGVPQRELARRVGRSQSHVSKRQSLLKLPERAKHLLDTETISVQTALGMTGLLKHNDKLAKVLDYAVSQGDVTDRSIGQQVFWALDEIKRDVERAKQARETDEKVARLRAAGTLTDLSDTDDDDDEWDRWERCDEVDAEAFELTSAGRLVFYRRDDIDNDTDNDADDSPAGFRPAPLTDDERAGRDAEQRAEREHTERKTAERRSVADNLAGDGYPDLPAAATLIAAAFVTEQAENIVDDEALLARLGVDVRDDACTLNEIEAEVLRLVDRDPDVVLRAAFVLAVERGVKITDRPDRHWWASDVTFRRTFLRLLVEHGYDPTDHERQLLATTTVDLTDDAGSNELEAYAAPASPPVPDTTDRESTDEDVNDARSVEGAAASTPPWRNYDGHPLPMVLNVIRKTDDRARLDTIAAYELDHKNREEVIDAIDRRAAELDASCELDAS